MDVASQQLNTLLRLALHTAEVECTCDESGEIVHRYIEFKLRGVGDLPDDLKKVEQHLRVCPGCFEVVSAIIETLKREQA